MSVMKLWQDNVAQQFNKKLYLTNECKCILAFFFVSTNLTCKTGQAAREQLEIITIFGIIQCDL